jgi:polyphosphate kinase 2 (PPK2 family)
MKNETDRYLVKAKKIKLKDFDTSYHGLLDKEQGKAALKAVKNELSEYQEILYAANTQSLLIIFQAMDAAGKDSAIAHVMSGLNPQGCQVYSFKTPSSEEYDHDFLWRHYKALPEKGRIGIHNRSHYENVLVCKVHPEYILNERLTE